MYMFMLGVLLGSGAVLAFQELKHQFSEWMEDRVQAEVDRRAQDSTTDVPRVVYNLPEADW